jgi:hypothetical protein
MPLTTGGDGTVSGAIVLMEPIAEDVSRSHLLAKHDGAVPQPA